MKRNYAGLTIGITEAVKNFRKTIDSSNGQPIALLQANKPIAYIVPTETYEQMVDELNMAKNKKSL